MRIAVMGAGGVGGYFGARLAQAGNDVAFVARGRHLAAMRERGLAVKSALGDVTIARPAVTDDPASARAGRRRAVRGQALGYRERRGSDARRCVANGRRRHSVPERRREHRADRRRRRRAPRDGRRRVHRGDDRRARRHRAHRARWRACASARSQPSQQTAAEALLAACQGAGIDAELSADIRRALWEKFAFLAAFSGLDERRPAAARRAARRSRTCARRSRRRYARRGPSAARRASRSPTISSPSR